MSDPGSDLKDRTLDSAPLPLYDGPVCRVCCDLIPNDPALQGIPKLSLGVALSDVYRAAETCGNCALVLEALRCFDGPRGDKLRIESEFGTPIRLSYPYKLLDETPRHIVVFSSPVSGTLTAGWIEPEITPQKAARIAQSWLRECLDSHKECMADSFIPTRVVHVGTASRPPCLIETTEDMKTADYIALSYCWGSAETLTTTKATLQNRLRGIRREDIPKTLYEAIEFVQHLGLSYIWIDALCIIQDDVLDWEKEAAQIKKIYESALLTLSATSSPDVSAGCFLARTAEVHELHSPRPGHRYYARRSCAGTHEALFLDDDGIINNIPKYPAMMRGWVYQERLLSQRILYCAFDELIWECQKSIRCECSLNNMANGAYFNPTVDYRRKVKLLSNPNYNSQHHHIDCPLEVSEIWLKLVESYSRRAFSRYSDRLMALTGIAQTFQSLDMGIYYLGIWSDRIHLHLAWARDNSPWFRDVDKGIRISSFPSWSWCSITQPCQIEFASSDKISTRLVLLGYKEEAKSPDSHGMASHARLSLSAPCVEGRIVTVFTTEDNPSGLLDVFVLYRGKEYYVKTDVPQRLVPETSMPPEENLKPSDQVLCLELYASIKTDTGYGPVNPYCPWNIPNDEEDHYYQFPWLVIKWSPSHNAYRRVGLIDFTNKEWLDPETQAPGVMMRHAVIKQVDIV
ncbi:heterokaryon incompatibility protein-domain-containing protein [Triangularia verruculosa]|uniref:Heterokaryon incompatibility protein-domain-containing protein n=1 Tax=Triangularia verruculosa TaxID=2587418 RepID=A0AAN6XHH7_9PEZI|nr:heterokaryon incompatibility protein-domain-containing protein [Triangularia verruculosa]